MSKLIASILLFFSSLFPGPKVAISSQEFTNGGAIPLRFTCNGDNINPPLIFDRVPGDAKSLVLIVEDDKAFTHWSVFNIDPTITNIEEGKIPEALEGTNDFGELKYMGPCSTEKHKYYFKVYALDTLLSLDEGAKKSEIETAMQKHIIAKGELYGL
ncbi:MAG TPA: YbhB/YbcL family Raf kinase inhibitor-like protein [Alphaproteobacteria bacterium]|jgi:Raf kinase inhibitor-like YbhB/YbcL family protein|nr:YbhB/YbcL family Raf kinase inhibitor-like protein [Alphaproteobacteria bacterium]